MKGVYILIKDDDVLYIGASLNLERRIYQHRDKDYDFYVLIPYGKRYEQLETMLISFVKPLLNKVKLCHNEWFYYDHCDAFRGLNSGKISRYLNT
jgi:hypothetical protein